MGGAGTVVRRAPRWRDAVADDFRGASWGQRLALVGVVVWLGYEWGIGNETVTPWLLARVIADTDGAGAIATAMLVGFGFTLAQQLLAGLTALAGFSLFDRTARASWDRLTARFGNVPGEWSTLGWGARCVVVFGLGTTAVALVQVTATGTVGVRRHARAVAASALLCATLVALVGGAAAGLAVVGREIDGLAGPTDWVLRVLGNPLLWLGLLIVGLVAQTLRREPSPALAAETPPDATE